MHKACGNFLLLFSYCYSVCNKYNFRNIFVKTGVKIGNKNTLLSLLKHGKTKQIFVIKAKHDYNATL